MYFDAEGISSLRTIPMSDRGGRNGTYAMYPDHDDPRTRFQRRNVTFCSCLLILKYFSFTLLIEGTEEEVLIEKQDGEDCKSSNYKGDDGDQDMDDRICFPKGHFAEFHLGLILI